VKPLGQWTAEIIESQRRLFTTELCEPEAANRHLVEVIQMNRLPTENLNAVYYYADMELCTMDLKKFLQIPQFSGESNIWQIMYQIAKGVEFVHSHGLVIRDLKPSRGTYLWQTYSDSAVLQNPSCRVVETWRFQPGLRART
jgi:serine/threonine protein kinase